ncbi:MAG TPA: hypothetical protein DCY84_07645 [Firmicutes bacterium]|jgi:uncharacterized membrane protein|nr:hypothetical protein [Bacillota bacterium]HBR23748.1 hypothetical protein [Bacillota bacterium]
MPDNKNAASPDTKARKQIQTFALVLKLLGGWVLFCSIIGLVFSLSGIFNELQASVSETSFATRIFAYFLAAFALGLLLGGAAIFAGINIGKYHRWAKRLSEVLLVTFSLFLAGFALILSMLIPAFPPPIGAGVKIMAAFSVLLFIIPIYLCLRWLRSRQVTTLFD